KAVDVFFGGDCLDDLGCVHVTRQRQLDQDSMDGGILVELPHHIEQFGLGGVFAHADHARIQPGLFAGGGLVAHVDLRGRVFAYQHDRQAGLNSTGGKRLHAFGNFGANGVGQRLAIDNASAHAEPSALVSAIFMRSATVVTSSFSMILARWASTVLILIFRSPAICLFRRPATMRSSTCCSRAVRRLSTACWSRRARAWFTRSAASSSMRATISRRSLSLNGFSRKSTAPFFM